MAPQEPSAEGASLMPPPPPRLGMPLGGVGAPPPPPVMAPPAAPAVAAPPPHRAAPPAAPPILPSAPAPAVPAPAVPAPSAPAPAVPAPAAPAPAMHDLPQAEIKPSREIPPVRPSAPRPLPSEKGRPVSVPNAASRAASKVPSVPVLFDNEPQSDEVDEPDSDDKYPEVMLDALHVLDPLCLKWNLSKLSTPSAVAAAPQEAPAPAAAAPASAAAPAAPPHALMPAPVAASAPIPSSARLSNGYLRLLGLLANGSPWECSVPLADMGRQGGIVIGRDPATCEIVLTEGSISRRHAALNLTDNGVLISDLGSTNGTYVNGRRLSYYEPQSILQDGCVLGLGDVSLRVEIFSTSNSYFSV